MSSRYFFSRLLSSKVAYEDSDMSLSVSNLQNNIEWSGQNINTIFADRYRIFDIKFLRFLIDILRFNRFVKKNIDELSNDKKPLRAQRPEVL